jgi:hypothetical protein
MRPLKILICKIVVALCMVPSAGWSQSLLLRSGIYDFTDNTAREFYKVAVVFSAGANVWNRERMHLSVSAGLGFNSVRYNGHRHNLYMIPVIADISE